MEQPREFEHKTYPTHICPLNKVIYGLWQAHQAWYNELKNNFVLLGFIKYESDISFFVRHHSYAIVYLLILMYVDGIIVTGTNTLVINQVITSLAARFSVKHLEALTYFLGIEIIRNVDGIIMT